MFKQFSEHIFRSLFHHPLALLSSLMVLTSTYTIIAGFFVVTHNVDGSFKSVGKNVQLSVYLEDKASKEDVAKIETFLNNLENFEKPSFTSKSKAAEYFKKSMISYAPDLLNDEYGNPLPASFEISCNPRYCLTNN
ncbi:MAG: permease-like cell division protein FtsX [Bdellovibrionales bacterium]